LPASENKLMLEDYEKKKQKQMSSMRSWLDYGRGIFFTALGVVLIIHDKLKIPTQKWVTSNAVKTFGVLFVLYGIWRIYQGYKKNYFQ
jgi:hypothetical protein